MMSVVTVVTVSESFDDPFGVGGPRQRLDEGETVERMLRAGMAMVDDAGLRISFDLLRIEDVIVKAGVSRSAVYKRWPRKEQYYADLLLRLAGQTHAAESAFDLGTPDVVIRVAQENISWFATAEGRRKLVVEICRVGALQNFNALRTRPDWHIYMTIHSALLTLPDNSYRAELESALGSSEHGFIQKMGEFYEAMRMIVGYRFKDDGNGFGAKEFASLGAAAVEGLVLTSGATPDLATHRFLIDPFGTGTAQEWSYAALGFTSIAMAVLEQSDTSDWDDERIENIKALLSAVGEDLRAGE